MVSSSKCNNFSQVLEQTDADCQSFLN